MKYNQYWREIKFNKLPWKRVTNLLTYAVMFDSLTVAYVQFLIMLPELQNVLSHELKYLCNKTATNLLQWTAPKVMDVSLLHLNFRNLYILYIQYIYTLKVHMTISGVVIHYVGLDCKSPNPLKIHCFK